MNDPCRMRAECWLHYHSSPQQIFILPWHSSSHPHYLRSTLIISCHLRQNLLGISCPLSVCIKNVWHFSSFLCLTLNNTGLLISPYPDQEGNKLQRQKFLSFIYPIYNHNWRNISTFHIYNKTSIKRNIFTIKQNTSGSRSG